MEKFLLEKQLSKSDWLGFQTKSVVDNYKKQLMLSIRGDIEFGVDLETGDPSIYSYRDDNYYVLRKRNNQDYDGSFETYYENLGGNFSSFKKIEKSEFDFIFHKFGTYLESNFHIYADFYNNIELLGDIDLLKTNLLEQVYYNFGQEISIYVSKILEDILFTIEMTGKYDYNRQINTGNSNNIFYDFNSKSITTQQHILFMLTKLVENNLPISDFINIIENIDKKDFKTNNSKILIDTFELVNLYYSLFFDKEFDIKNIFQKVCILIEETQTEIIRNKLLSIKSLIENILFKIKKNNE